MGETTKGEFGKNCNRSTCQNPNSAYWYNYSTRKYYCGDCAILINEANKEDATKLFGHDLCLEVHVPVI